jgi:hypothetical protein
MAHLSKAFLQEIHKYLERIMVTGVKIECVSIIDNKAELRFMFVDGEGRDILEACTFHLHPGDTVDMGGLERALNVTIG